MNNDTQKPDPRLHIVATTAIIERDGKYLILKRSEREIAHPGEWTVPGGKVERGDYEGTPITPGTNGWYGVVAKALAREVEEEAGLMVKDIHYLTDMVFVRPDNIPVVVLSYWCRWKSGEVVLGKDMTDSAWITPEEGKNFKIIPGILDEIKEVDRVVKAL